jgi:putative transposase
MGVKITERMRDKPKFKSNRHVSYSGKYHDVFCPKYRRKVLIDGVGKRLKEIIHQVAKELGCEVPELEVMPDPIRKFVKLVKGRSSRLLRQEFPQLKSRLPTLWTYAYFVSTVGGAPTAILTQYIEDQKTV